MYLPRKDVGDRTTADTQAVALSREAIANERDTSQEDDREWLRSVQDGADEEYSSACRSGYT